MRMQSRLFIQQTSWVMGRRFLYHFKLMYVHMRARVNNLIMWKYNTPRGLPCGITEIPKLNKNQTKINLFFSHTTSKSRLGHLLCTDWWYSVPRNFLAKSYNHVSSTWDLGLSRCWLHRLCHSVLWSHGGGYWSFYGKYDFNREDGGYMFFRNSGNILQYHTASKPRET
jgi:hypothetical protein